MTTPASQSFQGTDLPSRKGAIFIDCDDCLHLINQDLYNLMVNLSVNAICHFAHMKPDEAKKMALHDFYTTGDAYTTIRKEHGFSLYTQIYEGFDHSMSDAFIGNVAPNTAAVIEYIHQNIQPVFIVSHCMQKPLETRLKNIGFSDEFIKSQSVGIDYFAHENRMQLLSENHNNRNSLTDPPPGWMRKDIANPFQSIFTQLALLKDLSLPNCAFFDDSKLNIQIASQMGVGHNYLISRESSILQALEIDINGRFNINLHDNFANKDCTASQFSL